MSHVTCGAASRRGSGRRWPREAASNWRGERRADNPYLPTGSVALAMLEQHGAASVLLVREREPKREKAATAVKRPFLVLFPVDGSASIGQVVERFHGLLHVPEPQPVAVAVAEPPNAGLPVQLGAQERRALLGRIQAAARGWARQARPLLARPGVRPQIRIVQGPALKALIDEASREAGRVVVLGSGGACGPSGPPLGSVALQAARYAPCSALLMRDSV